MSILNEILGGPNVTVQNPSVPPVLYIKGSEFVDGSRRLLVTPEGTVQVRAREGGVWGLADIEFNIVTWIIDDILGEIVLDETGQIVLMDP